MEYKNETNIICFENCSEDEAVNIPQTDDQSEFVITSQKSSEKLKEIISKLEGGIATIFESEKYKEYLKVMSKFYDYSLYNTMLIAMQKPYASYVAGYKKWQRDFKRNVKKGEKGISIIAPVLRKVKNDKSRSTTLSYENGLNDSTEPEKSDDEKIFLIFKVVKVFDVSQTEGEELPSYVVDTLTGSIENYENFFAAIAEASPVPICFEKIQGGAKGYYNLKDKRIAINEGMSELHVLKTAVHEVAHAKLHDIDVGNTKEILKNFDRRTKEVEAESVAYVVCQNYGLDTSDYSFGYIAGWSGDKELPQLKKSLETIHKASAEIINDMNKYLIEHSEIKKSKVA